MRINSGAVNPWSSDPDWSGAALDAGEENRIVYQSPTVVIDSFRTKPRQRLWEGLSFTRTCMVVFPRSFVEIAQADRERIIASPNVAMLYNRHQEFTRGSIGHADCNESFHYAEETVREALAAYDPAAADRDTPFQYSHCPTSPATYLLQRRVYLMARANLNPLMIEEGAMQVLSSVMRDAHRVWPRAVHAHRPDTAAWRADVVRGVQEIIARDPNRAHSLPDLAQGVHVSMYHLCRIFHEESGMTISAYLHQQRLRRSLERVVESDSALTELALEFGYSSHSHFTARFRQEFGITPSGARRTLFHPRSKRNCTNS